MAEGFNANLREIRKSKKITQEQLAEAVGVSPQAVSKWELNGFPDSPLLPAIADCLGVSIDRLFGKVDEKADIKDEIVWYMKEQPQEEMLQRGMELCRAISLGIMYSENYLGISDNAFYASDYELHSECTRKEGFVQSRLCESLQYFLIMPEPKKGYDDVLKYDEKYVKLFSLLSKPNALRILYYFAGKNDWTFLTAKSLAKELNIALENTREILDGMEELKLLDSSVLCSERGEEKIYKSYLDCNLVSFMTFCRTLLNKPNSFNYQSTNRDGVRYFKNATEIVKKEKEQRND